MKKLVLPILLAITMSFVITSAAWAGGGQKAAELSKQCQEALKKTPNQEAANLCNEGDTLIKQGKNEEATAKLKAGLEKLGVKVGTPKTMPKK